VVKLYVIYCIGYLALAMMIVTLNMVWDCTNFKVHIYCYHITMINFRFAIACFLVLFGLTQLWSWMQQFALQQPAFMVGGVALAMASNWQRRAAFPFDVLHQWLEQRSVKLPVERGDSPLASNLDHDGVKKS
jgi:hypothetical protein